MGDTRKDKRDAQISGYLEELQTIRRDIHKHPETAYEENRTADIVAEKLNEWGLEVDRGLGGTGVVGTLRRGGSNRAIGLRADMDALFIQEMNEFDHKSVNKGKMHACGHDGHTTIRQIGVSEQSYYRWRKEYGGLKVNRTVMSLSATA